MECVDYFCTYAVFTFDDVKMSQWHFKATIYNQKKKNKLKHSTYHSESIVFKKYSITNIQTNLNIIFYDTRYIF